MDDVVVFRPLSRDDLGRIVDLQLDHLRRLLGDRKIGLEVTTEAKRLVAEECGALLRGIFLEVAALESTGKRVRGLGGEPRCYRSPLNAM